MTVHDLCFLLSHFGGQIICQRLGLSDRICQCTPESLDLCLHTCYLFRTDDHLNFLDHRRFTDADTG